MILDFSNMNDDSPRKDGEKVKSRFWSSRVDYWASRGLPKVIATYLADINAPVSPKKDKDKQVRKQINEYIGDFKALVKMMGVEKALGVLKIKNAKYSRPEGMIFTLGSP